MNWVCDRYGPMVCKTAVKLQAWLAHNVVKVLLFAEAGFGTYVEAVPHAYSRRVILRERNY